MAGDLGGTVQNADIGVGGYQGERPAHGFRRDGVMEMVPYSDSNQRITSQAARHLLRARPRLLEAKY